MFISLTSMAGGVLNAYGKFAIPAFTPVILNVCLIASAFVDSGSVYALAWAVFLAGILQFAFQLPSLFKLRLMPMPRWGWGDARVRRIVGLMLPRSEEHTSELQSLMRISYAVFCLKKKKIINTVNTVKQTTKAKEHHHMM